MRSETLCLYGLDLDTNEREYAALDWWIARNETEPTNQGDRFAVEVCWITAGTVTCRTFQVSASTEGRAARIACRRARKALDETVTRIEAVDIERIERGSWHE